MGTERRAGCRETCTSGSGRGRGKPVGEIRHGARVPTSYVTREERFDDSALTFEGLDMGTFLAS